MGIDQRLTFNRIGGKNEKNKPDALFENSGFKIEKKRTLNGDNIFEIKTHSGDILFVDFSFPEFDLNNDKLFYSNNPPEVRATPLKLECKTFEFLQLENKYKNSLRQNSPSTLIGKIELLEQTMKQEIKSSLANENIRSSNDILIKKSSACVGQSLISSMILKKVFPSLSVQTIAGSTEQVGQMECQTHSFGHEWIRIQEKNEVVLYDPHYHKIRSYDLKNPTTNDNDPFAKYDVDALPFAKIGEMLESESGDTNMKIIAIDNEARGEGLTYKYRVPTDFALYSQIFGSIAGNIRSRGGSLKITNNGISTPIKNQPDSARLLYPIKKINKE
ncbi:MAG: hypothetical protein WC848_04915 [Parcubacteria group bacterium]|jgi:hypothetical protein